MELESALNLPRIDPASRASTMWLGLIAIISIVGGCDSNRSRLVGTWTCKMLPDRLVVDEASPLDSAGDELSPGLGNEHSIRLRFYGNGRMDTVTHLPNIRTQKSGQWRLLSFDEGSQTATIECELMQQRTEHQLEFIDSDTIKLVPPNLAGLKLTLEFKKER